GLVGHSQAQYLHEVQPMKFAAAEALWDTEQPASLSLLTIGDLSGREEVFSIRLPAMLSLLACNNLTCEVVGMNTLQEQMVEQWGAGDYVPPIPILYWSFRIMLTSGLVMIGVALLGLFFLFRDSLQKQSWFLRLLPLAIFLPYLANTTGWLLAETGRQPWIVYGLMKTVEGASASVGAGNVLFSLLVFGLIYATLMVADIYLLAKYARKGPAEETHEAPVLAVSG
ncbi:MAG: cytochrome ubiquinol oxidase subunit I, partial [Anaerolineae bacterium]